jgi:hypothetical protein
MGQVVGYIIETHEVVDLTLCGCSGLQLFFYMCLMGAYNW